MRRLLLGVALCLPLAAQVSIFPSTTAKRIQRGTSLPATCQVGEVYFKTSAAVGTYQCTATNTWEIWGSVALTSSYYRYPTVGTTTLSVGVTTITHNLGNDGSHIQCFAAGIAISVPFENVSANATEITISEEVAEAHCVVISGGTISSAMVDDGDAITVTGRTVTALLSAPSLANVSEGGCTTNTDLVVDATDNTKVTSAGYTFVAADVGGIVVITAGTGWTTGTYHVQSVASGAAVLDRSPAAVTTTGGTYTLNRGRIAMVQGGAGVADTVRVCRKDAGNSYAWTALY